MDEHIKREALIESIKNLKHYLNTGIARHNLTQKDIMRVLEKFPAADVVEVVHGRWIAHEVDAECCSGTEYECSVCGKYEYVDSTYCPNCGAKMG